MTDLSEFRGPDPKPGTPGGTGRKKKPKALSAEFIEAKEEKRRRKEMETASCRTCENKGGWRLEPHHIVRRGAPHFGGWQRENIMFLCLECHTKNHAGNKTIKKRIRAALTRAEVDWSDSQAYQGFVDAEYFKLPNDSHGQTLVAGEVVARPKAASSAPPVPEEQQ